MPTKRKAIHDFFQPTKKCSRSPVNQDAPQDCQAEGPLKGKETVQIKKTPVPGLLLYIDFVNHAEEEETLAFLDDPKQCTWRTDLSRRTMHFGGTYCLMPQKTSNPTATKPVVLQAPSMPQKLQWLIQRMVDSDIYDNEQRPQYCIVNEYTGDLGISAHTENFKFGEPVAGLSLSSPCHIRFHELMRPCDGSVRSGKAAKAQKTRRVVDVELPARSLLVMNGPSRWSWQHEIVRSAKGRGPGWKRISLTFRYKP
ncbi:MAG: hypothetical protein Q9171_007235 [Xanthocarpia ochracea]